MTITGIIRVWFQWLGQILCTIYYLSIPRDPTFVAFQWLDPSLFWDAKLDHFEGLRFEISMGSDEASGADDEDGEVGIGEAGDQDGKGWS